MSMYVLFLVWGELPFCVNGRIALFLCEWANCHSPLQMPYRLICGCKGTAFFQTSKFFVNFFYDFFNLFFKWLRINRDLKENLGETPRCRRGGWAGGDGVGGGGGAVGEKLGGTRRNSEGMGGVRVFSGDVSDGSCGRRWELWDLEKERGVMGFGGDGSGGVLFFGGEFWGVNN